MFRPGTAGEGPDRLPAVVLVADHVGQRVGCQHGHRHLGVDQVCPARPARTDREHDVTWSAGFGSGVAAESHAAGLQVADDVARRRCGFELHRARQVCGAEADRTDDHVGQRDGPVAAQARDATLDTVRVADERGGRLRVRRRAGDVCGGDAITEVILAS
jgi:hypothetical protein